MTKAIPILWVGNTNVGLDFTLLDDDNDPIDLTHPQTTVQLVISRLKTINGVILDIPTAQVRFYYYGDWTPGIYELNAKVNFGTGGSFYSDPSLVEVRKQPEIQ